MVGWIQESITSVSLFLRYDNSPKVDIGIGYNTHIDSKEYTMKQLSQRRADQKLAKELKKERKQANKAQEEKKAKEQK